MKSFDILCASQFALWHGLTSPDELGLNWTCWPRGTGGSDRGEGTDPALVQHVGAPQGAHGNHWVAQTNSEMNSTSWSSFWFIFLLGVSLVRVEDVFLTVLGLGFIAWETC